MSIYRKLADLDKVFNQLPVQPMIINDISIYSEEDKEAIKKKIFTKYDTDVMSVVPRCGCDGIDSLSGEFNRGRVCKNCGQAVVSPSEQDLAPILWMRAPTGVQKLVNPYVWGILSATFTASGFDLIRWICDTSYTSNNKTPIEVSQLEDLGVMNGFNNFIQNFDKYIEILFSLRRFRKHARKEDILRFLKENRNKIFCDYIPLPNKSLLVIEDTTVGRILDTIIVNAVDAILMFAGIDTNHNNLTVRKKENRSVKVLSALANDFYAKYYKNNLGTKPGIIRKHIMGTRAFWSFRAVISSITQPHKYEKLSVPWGVGVGALFYHLLNKLTARGWHGNEACAFLSAHAQKYHPLIDQMFDEIIAENPEGGVPCVFCRNPSLMRGSIQKFHITKFHKDPTIPTIMLSSLCVVGLNADFDGDACSCMLLLDEVMSVEMNHFKPHKSTFDVNKIRSVSSNLSIPKPVVATISAWIHEEDEVVDQSRMLEFSA